MTIGLGGSVAWSNPAGRGQRPAEWDATRGTAGAGPPGVDRILLAISDRCQSRRELSLEAYFLATADLIDISSAEACLN